MKKFLVLLSTIVSILLLNVLIKPAFAHDFGPVPPEGCPPNHVPQSTGCHHVQNSGIGTITPPGGTVPTVGSGQESDFVAGVVRNGLSLFLIIAFIIALIYFLIAGLMFIFANGDPKNVSSAWARIYWGIIGLVIVLSAFAIIKLVETFFKVQIISGPFSLPRI